MLAALAEQVRGGILLVICILIGGFFFLDAGINIFGRQKSAKHAEQTGDTIRFRVYYKNKIYGEDEFRTLEPGGEIRAGFGPGCDPDFSSRPLPREIEEEVWFRVVKNSAGVLMAVKDPAADGLRVREDSDPRYRVFSKTLLRDALQIEKDEVEIRVEKQA